MIEAMLKLQRQMKEVLRRLDALENPRPGLDGTTRS